MTIKARCEEAFKNLEDINPDHELMHYDGTGLSNQEQEQLTDRLLEKFGPDDYNSYCPTDEELCIAFEGLRNVLLAAVAIERAQAGICGRN